MRGYKNKRSLYLAIAAVLVLSFVSYDLLMRSSQASAAATVDTSTNSAATDMAAQRKTFYDSSTALYWAFYFNGTAVAYANSPDGTTWTSRGTTGAASSDFSVAPTAGVVYLIYNSAGAFVEKGTLGSTSITWSGVTRASATTQASSYNSIAQDSNGRIWVLYRYTTTGASSHLVVVAVESTNPNDTTAWGAETTLWSEIHLAADVDFSLAIVKMSTSGNMYFIRVNNTDITNASISGRLYTAAGSTFGSDTSIATLDSLAVTSGGLMSAVAGTSDTIHLVFSGASSAAPTNGAVYYVKYSSGAWGTQITLDSNTTNQAPQISIDGSGNLYAFWIRANTIFYKKGVSPYAAGNWDASPTTFYNTGTNNSLSSSYTQGNSTIQLLWTQGTGSPFSIEFATLNISSNATPAAPTLNAPSSGATGVAVTPQFQLSTTDADSDYLRYDIVVYQSDCSTLVRDIDQTSSQTGWSGQDQQTSTAYTGATTLGSSTMANHTYQAAALSYSTTYCWKGRAIDPGGSNTWSGYSSTQSFSTGSALPSAPVNINGGANVRGGSSIQ